MSWSINSSKIDLQKQEKLRETLYLKPGKDGEPLLCIKETNNTIFIPFYFGKHIYKKRIEHENTTINFKGSLRSYQKEPVEKTKEYLQKGSCIFNCSTAFGKTVCAIYLCTLYHKITCVVYPLKSLAIQWKKALEEFSDAKVFINDGRKFNEKANIILTTPGKIKKIPESFLKRIGFLVVDEVHMFCTNKRYADLMEIEPSHCLALTATLEKEKYQLDALRLMFGPILKHDTKKKVSVIRFVTDITIPLVKNRQGKLDWSYICRTSASHPERNRKIVNFLLDNSEKTLVLTYLVSHAKTLYSLYKEQRDDVSLLVQKDPNYLDARVLISTSKKSGTGFDDKNFCDNFSGKRFRVLVITFSLKSVLFLKQLLGRVFRHDDPLIVEFVDNHPVTISHAREREKYYEEQEYNVFKEQL